jgi:hypothetical protein
MKLFFTGNVQNLVCDALCSLFSFIHSKTNFATVELVYIDIMTSICAGDEVVFT